MFTFSMSLAQVARFMSKEVCLYAGADWLKLICQSEGDQRSVAAESIVSVYIQSHRCVLKSEENLSPSLNRKSRELLVVVLLQNKILI